MDRLHPLVPKLVSRRNKKIHESGESGADGFAEHMKNLE